MIGIIRYWRAIYRLGKAIKRFFFTKEVLEAGYVVGKNASLSCSNFDPGKNFLVLTFELLDEKAFNKEYKIDEITRQILETRK